MSKNTHTPIAPDVAQNMTQAENLYGISKAVQIIAKQNGCAAFKSQRIHKAPLLAWVKSNKKLVTQAETEAAGKADIAKLKLQKLLAEVLMLEEKNRRLEASLIPRKTVLEVWQSCWQIVCEESAKLMHIDKHEVLIHRLESQLAVPLARAATPT